MENINETTTGDVPSLARSYHARFKNTYTETGFSEILEQYTGLISARMQSNKENAVSAIVHLYNDTDSKTIKAWLLVAAWEMTIKK